MGRKFSEETRAKMSAAAKRSWKNRRAKNVAKNAVAAVERGGDPVPADSIVLAVRSAKTLVELVGKKVAKALIDV